MRKGLLADFVGSPTVRTGFFVRGATPCVAGTAFMASHALFCNEEQSCDLRFFWPYFINP